MLSHNLKKLAEFIQEEKPGLEYSKLEDHELHKLVERGAAVTEMFSEGSPMRELVIPAMEAELDKCREKLEWRPGRTASTAEAAGVDRIWLSALIAGGELLWDVSNTIRHEAEDAAKELKERDERRKRDAAK